MVIEIPSSWVCFSWESWVIRSLAGKAPPTASTSIWEPHLGRKKYLGQADPSGPCGGADLALLFALSHLSYWTQDTVNSRHAERSEKGMFDCCLKKVNFLFDCLPERIPLTQPILENTEHIKTFLLSYRLGPEVSGQLLCILAYLI